MTGRASAPGRAAMPAGAALRAQPVGPGGPGPAPRPRRQPHLLALLLLAGPLLLGGCTIGDDDDDRPQVVAPDDCSDAGQKDFVLEVMQDIYFWDGQLPDDPQPERFATAEDLLDSLLFQPIDRFSFIGDAAADDAFFSESQFIGVGIGLRTTDTQVFITQVFGDGPAAATAMARGDEILRINGMDTADVLAGEGLSAAFGDDEIGVLVELRVRSLSGVEQDYVLFKDLVTIEPVPATALLEVDGRPIGYVAFRDFVEPAFDALDAAFAPLEEAGVSELILDLRYNGGGLLSVSEYLANLLAERFVGSEFYTRRHNEGNSDLNRTQAFLGQRNALSLQRLVVITTGSTASASELVINGLTPYLEEVTLVGEPTFGKPVGQYGFQFCGKILRPASFVLENSRGSSDYFDGFRPDCAATDDLTRPLGDPEEGMLAEALGVIRTGGCLTPFATTLAAGEKAARKQLQAWRRAAARAVRRGELGSAW